MCRRDTRLITPLPRLIARRAERAANLRRREPSVHARADLIGEINASLLTGTVSLFVRALLLSMSTASNGAARGVDTSIVRRSL
jgi:hypothetical protein